MREAHLLRSVLKKLVCSGFDLLRICGLKILIFRIAITGRKVFGTGFYGFIYFYCYGREEFGLCDRLIEHYQVPIPNRLPHSLQPSPGIPEDKLTESMRRFFEAANTAGFEPFLTFGTLLGYVREKRFIPWDRDLDIGLFYDRTDTEKLVQTLSDAGFIITEYTGREFPSKIKCCLRDFPIIDITFFKKDGEKLLTVGRLKNGKSIVRQRTPFGLTDTVFYDVPVRIPANPEIFLTENYGDWETPKQVYHYILDSRLTDYNSPDIKYLAITTLIRHLQRQDGQAVIHYLNLFSEKLPEDPVWALIKEKLNGHNYLY